MQVFEILRQTAQRLPEKPALICDDKTITYAEFENYALALAAQLQNIGIQRGDRVALLLPNCNEFAVAYFACAAAGFVSVPLNNRLAAKELVFILNNCSAVALVVGYQYWDVAKEILPQLQFMKTLVYAGPEEKEGSHYFEHLIAGKERPVLPEIGMDETACIMYTSGTTGQPKGAMMTHRNIIANARNCGAHLNYKESDRTLVSVPLFHVTGLNSQLVAFTYVGGTCVIMKAYKTSDMIELINRQQTNVLFCVPTMYVLMLINEAINKYDISCVRIGAYGGAPMDKETVKELNQRFGMDLYNAYGLTETSSLTTILPCCDAVRKAPSVGLPVTGVQVRVIDSEGRDLPAGEAGELMIKGPNVVGGYFNNPEATAKALVDGWLHSGDVARIDEEGFVYIVDRMKDMVVRGGENIYSIEVESAVSAHPKVLESAVVPEPHHIFGEVVKTFVVLRPGEECTAEEIQEFCRQHIADFKVPATVVFVDELPRNPGGKVLKDALRKI